MHLAGMFPHGPTYLGFCDALDLGARGMWLNPSRSVHTLVWRQLWLPDIINSLVSETNPEGQLTNPLASPITLNSTLLAAIPEARMAAPCSVSYNTPTASWRTGEASTIYPVVANLIRIRALHLRHFSLNPSVFYHPEQYNYMVDDASCLFDLSDTSFLVHMSVAYP